MLRERYLDIVKGISILCIVLLHYVIGVFHQEFEVFVGSFMITAFYVTVGWLSAMKPSILTFKEFLVKRFKQLGIPYLWWTAIILVFDFILYLFGYYDFRFIGTEVYKSIVLRGIGTLWFLPALFGGEIIWFWLSRQRGWCIVLAVALTIAYQCVYSEVFSGHNEVIYRIIDAPFRTISNILGAWVGIAFGFYAYKLSSRIIEKKSIVFLVGLLLLCFAFVAANYYPFGFKIGWHYLAPLWGPLGLILVMKSIQNLPILSYFNYWGINSLNLMVTHYSITLVLIRIFVTKVIGIPFVGWVTLVSFIVTIPIQHLFVSFINRYIPKTLGK